MKSKPAGSRKTISPLASSLEFTVNLRYSDYMITTAHLAISLALPTGRRRSLCSA